MAVTVDDFMAALQGQESGGNPQAENDRTGAYGLWQIMPSNWAPWAQEAGLSANAPQTAQNQRIVARHKMQQYYDDYGSWDAVAVAWFAGPSRASAYVQGDKSVLGISDGNMTVGEYVQTLQGALGNVSGTPAPTQGAATATPADEEDDFDPEPALAALFDNMSTAIANTNTPFDGTGMESVMAGLFPLGEEDDAEAQDDEEPVDARSQAVEMAETGAVGMGVDEKGRVRTAAGELAVSDDPKYRSPRAQDVVDEERAEWGAESIGNWGTNLAESFGLEITSHQRTPEENEDVGGVEDSDHLWGGGVDFGGDRARQQRLYQWLKPFEGNGVIRLVLDEGDHIHVSFERDASGAAPTREA